MFDLFRGNPAPGLSSPMSRRAFTFTAGALAVSGMMRPGGLAAQGQQRLEVVPGGTQAIPIAIRKAPNAATWNQICRDGSSNRLRRRVIPIRPSA